MSDALSPPPFTPRRRLWIGYAAGAAIAVFGMGLRVAHAMVAMLLFRWFPSLNRYGSDPVFTGTADIALVVMCFGFAVLLLTLHHHYQSGAAPHRGRGFEPLPPPRG